MTAKPFTASLEQSASQYPPSLARRIAALLPEIEAARAQGSPRAHIVTALRGVGIDITPHQLSNLIARLRRRQARGVLPVAGQAPHAIDGSKAAMISSAASSQIGRIASVPTLADPATARPTSTGTASKYGAHDPRLLDEVMRSTPDMKALAKLAPKSTTQGNP
jgi:hypothetical protein